MSEEVPRPISSVSPASFYEKRVAVQDDFLEKLIAIRLKRDRDIKPIGRERPEKRGNVIRREREASSKNKEDQKKILEEKKRIVAVYERLTEEQKPFENEDEEIYLDEYDVQRAANLDKIIKSRTQSVFTSFLEENESRSEAFSILEKQNLLLTKSNLNV